MANGGDRTMSDDNEHRDLRRTEALASKELTTRLRRHREPASHGQASLLLYHRGGVQIAPLFEGRRTVIGRSSPSDVIVRDASLSRQHASIEMVRGEIWIEDHQSTNGTWIGDEQVQRSRVEAADELRLGAVPAAVQLLGPTENRQLGLFSHDHFLLDLQAESIRARTFGRNLALVMARKPRKLERGFSRWFSRVQQQLRPFDRMAMYSADTVEVLLPETDGQQARVWAAELLEEHAGALCGVGVMPVHAGTAGELLDVTHTALRESTAAHAVVTASPRASVDLASTAPRPGTGPIVCSPAMRDLFDKVARVASSVIPVLLLGETGVGKEIVARAIHEQGKRAERPLICVNCAAIPGQLIESTLFGHEKGAFTGAGQRATGVFEAADGGTVLLDEVGELPAAAQAALLRVLENKRFNRVGSSREIEVDVRIVAATHQHLEDMVAEGTFRKDLYYRLNTITLGIPPLRERREEIEPLARLFVERANHDNDRQVTDISQRALTLLVSHSWPGNVRELRNAIERAVVIAPDDVLTPEDLPEAVQGVGAVADLAAPSETVAEATIRTSDTPTGPLDIKEQLARYEAELIEAALKRAGWYRKGAAESLNMPVRTLAYKIKTYGIKRGS